MVTQMQNNIKNVIVLMFENRSFDHILGAFPGVNGVLLQDGSGNVNPGNYNTQNPLLPPNPIYNPAFIPSPINLETQSKLVHDFNHNFGDGMMPDLFGPGTTGYKNGQPIDSPPTTHPTTNCGFVSTIADNVTSSQYPSPPNGPAVMHYFEYNSLKVFHKLAAEFVICDNWFCDMPGDTLPNRAFMHCANSATSAITNDPCILDKGYNEPVTSPTIFGQIQKYGLDWKMYSPGGQVDSSWLTEITGNPNANVPIAQFCHDLQNGELPFYSFLCSFTASPPDTSMHLMDNVQPGENYLAAVYNALRNSPYWENTLLVVTFDENGGMYDHVPPPATISPVVGNPVAISSWDEGNTPYKTCQFDFTLLGPRVPALLISPWLSKGIDSTQYQNTSVLRYIQDLIALNQPLTDAPLSLSQRDLYAPSIEKAFYYFGCQEMRTDCPQYIEGYPYIGGGNICNPASANFYSGKQSLLAPPQYLVNLTKKYLQGLPGHPDSGGIINKTFETYAAMNDYSNERIEAADKYYAAKS